MNHSPTRPTLTPAAQSNCWSLEVVRGRVSGHRYVLEPGETVVGNALNGTKGVDLAEQEGNSPRKMAGRQAALTSTSQELTIRDLESPGGTFVNQQRLLAGQTRRLVPGDVIQLGSVQVRVAQASQPAVAVPAKTTVIPAKEPPAPPKPTAPSSPAIPGRLASPFTLADGSQCRSWDDFLVVAARSWPALRDELTSGRLAEYLRRIGRSELVPLAGSSRTPDDQLDDWLARVPAAGSSAPELDVHPETLVVRATSGGGLTRHVAPHHQCRLPALALYGACRACRDIVVATASGAYAGPSPRSTRRTCPSRSSCPRRIDRPLVAQVVIESNGGTRRIEVRIERPAEPVVIAEAVGASSPAPSLWRDELGRTVGRMRPGVRIAVGAVGAAALRLLVAFVSGLAGVSGPPLSSLAIVLVPAGAVAGLALARRRGEWRDLPAAAFAGGSLGLLGAAFWLAVLVTGERVLGPLSQVDRGRLNSLGNSGRSAGRGLDVSVSLPPGRRGGRAMKAVWWACGWSTLSVLCVLGSAHAQDPTPADKEIAAAIARGVAFLKETQSDEGHWDEPAQRDHRLGMTALAGLALLENGVARDAPAIMRARAVVFELAESSDQTYDLALAILFLARCQQGRRGEADALIQTLGRRLSGGELEGIWTYTVPTGDQEIESGSSRNRPGEGRRARRRGPFFAGQGDNSNTQFALLGLWAAGRHGFDSDSSLAAIDRHFRSTQLRDGRWGYRVGMGGTDSMSCAGLMGLAIAASRPSLAERQTARARGAALAADPGFRPP